VKLAIQLVALLVIVLPLQLHAAANAVSLEHAQLNAIELEALEPFPDFVVLSGHSEHGEKVLHRGEVVVSVYGAKPALLEINVPFPYDEFVWVLDGELTLTHEAGRSQTYGAGDSLLVPKGFKGTWEMRGDYRELVVIETRAYDSEDNWLKIAGSIVAGWFRDAPEPLPLKAAQLNDVELEPFEPTAADLELLGEHEAWQAAGMTRSYEGEFVVEVFASPPALVEITAPFPYDEFVWMLDGELVLTPVGGQAATYGPGAGVLVPKGFMGTWEIRGSYRELIIIEANAMGRDSEE
jgi:uncharacterized cupin superfamily protein